MTLLLQQSSQDRDPHSQLILNALALGFVLELDELIFQTFAPIRAKLLLSRLQPICSPHTPSWRGVDMYRIAAPMAAILLTWLCTQLVLHSQTQILIVARDAMCAGNLNFVYETLPHACRKRVIGRRRVAVIHIARLGCHVVARFVFCILILLRFARVLKAQ